MWVSSKVFMELVRNQTADGIKALKAENEIRNLKREVSELKKETAELKAEMATLRKEVLSVAKGATNNTGGGGNEHNAVDASKMLDELLNGVKDENIGRVRYTDGRD